MTHHTAIPIVAACAICHAVTSPAHAQEYEVTDLGATGTFNYAWSLNQHGDVAGYSNDEYRLNPEGFVYVQGRLRYVGGGGTSSLAAINNLGHAVGRLNTSQGSRAFIYMGHRVNLGTLGGDRSYGHCINDLGQAVGLAALPDNSLSGFIWENGEMSPLPIWPAWINNHGQIIGGGTLLTNGRTFSLERGRGNSAEGWYIHDNGDIAGAVRLTTPAGFPAPRATIWRDQKIVLQLGTLANPSPFEGEGHSLAKGINAEGVIVGMSTNATSSASVPFIYRRGEMLQLDDLMPEPWVAYHLATGAINDAGQIAVAAGIPGENGLHALLLTPIDQPCHPDCDQSTGAGVLDVFDFLCFQNSFVAGEPYACECDTSTGPSVCDVFDFLCFQNAFVRGCS